MYIIIRVKPSVSLQYLYYPNSTLITKGVNFFKALYILRVGQFRVFIFTDISIQDAVEIDTYFE